MNKSFEDELRAGRTLQWKAIVDQTDSNAASLGLDEECGRHVSRQQLRGANITSDFEQLYSLQGTVTTMAVVFWSLAFQYPCGTLESK